MSPIAIVFAVLLIVSGIGLVVFIMLHSGKGTGINDAIAASLSASQSGSSIVEKNLDRVTIILAIIFVTSLVALMIVFPHGTIGA